MDSDVNMAVCVQTMLVVTWCLGRVIVCQASLDLRVIKVRLCISADVDSSVKLENIN